MVLRPDPEAGRAATHLTHRAPNATAAAAQPKNKAFAHSESAPHDVKSAPIAQFFQGKVGALLQRALSDVFVEKPDDPIDAVAERLFQHCDSGHLSSGAEERNIIADSVHWLAQRLMRRNAHKLPRAEARWPNGNENPPPMRPARAGGSQ